MAEKIHLLEMSPEERLPYRVWPNDDGFRSPRAFEHFIASQMLEAGYLFAEKLVLTQHDEKENEEQEELTDGYIGPETATSNRSADQLNRRRSTQVGLRPVGATEELAIYGLTEDGRALVDRG